MDFVKLPKTKRGERTLQKIAKAAEELIAEKGYYGTEVQDITKRAGVATGTFYVYFPDKISVFSYVLDSLGRKVRRAIKQAKLSAVDTSFIEAERIATRSWFDFVREHIGILRIVFQALFVEPEKFKLYYERFSAGYMHELKSAQTAGEISTDLDPALISYALIGMHSFIALKIFLFDESEPDEEAIDQLVKFIAHGLHGDHSPT
ncbi:MAG: TetR/AcrR family transcriptional regulator [Oscillospiraceae bacterium]|nr:TetR/AcrR family transcriptional regulator [Oscillospiraceae bacterium]